MPGEQVDELLANGITSDAEQAVNMADLDSAKIRESSDKVVSAILSPSEGSTGPSVRYKRVDILTSGVRRGRRSARTAAHSRQRPGRARACLAKAAL
jgi:hypothetical protein